MGSKILLADDSITIQKVVNLTFADEGIEVISVSNGDMAERRLLEVDPDLVLADIFMPGKNGYELCETIKQHPQFCEVPVVLLVGAFEPYNESEARRVKADAHLTKPFESRVLVETVKNLIEQSPKQKSAPVNSQTLPPQATTEPPPLQNARPFAPPAIDFSTMSNPSPPQESVFADRLSASSFADSTPFADSFPNNFGFDQNPPPAPSASLEFTAGTSSASSQAESPTGAPLTQEAATFEPTPPTPYADLFKEESSFQTSENSVTTQSAANYGDVFDTQSPFDSSVALPPEIFEVAHPLDYQAQETAIFGSPGEHQVLDGMANQAASVAADFETPETIKEQNAQELPSTIVERAEPASRQVSEYQVEEVEKVEAEVARRFDTNELESPVESSFSPILNDADVALNGYGSLRDSHTNKEFSVDQNSSASDPSLLSADEPLGDVFNDFPNPDFAAPVVAAPLDFGEPTVATPESHTPALETQLDAESATEVTSEPVSESVTVESDPLGVFVSDSETAVLDEVSSQDEMAEAQTHEFSLVAPTHQESVPDVETVAESSTNNFEVTMPQKAEPIEVDAFPPASNEFSFYTEAEKEETPDMVASASLNETVVAEEAIAEDAADIADQFTASDMWEAQSQFTPVSIESSPVAQPTTAPPQETVEENAQVVPPVAMPVESTSPSESAAAEVVPQKEENHFEKTIPNEVEMNKEMMDEIVRQVVSQLSDSVIREIAWEVVPDCVERVVTNLTKQDLSRRL